jgi:hypothetical protein
MEDQSLLANGGTSDGSVSAQGLVSTSLMVGNSNGDDYASILTFNTTAMPDTGVSAASIFLRRESLTGTNPIGSSMLLKVAGGNFGASANVEPSDFAAPGDANGNPCQFGTSNSNGGWIRLEVPASLLPYITSNANTQFMLSAPGASGMVTFTGSSDPDFAPVLNITYGPQTTSIAEVNTALENLISLYPNPTNGQLYISNRTGNDISSIDIIDMPGKLVFSTQSVLEPLDISSLTPGNYLVRVTSADGQSTVKRIVKQ